MTAQQQATPRRALTGLPPRRTVAADPGVGRLRREQRAPIPLQSAFAAPPTPVPEPRSDVDDQALPLYLQLTRKEARIRADQADQLTAQVRRLNQARKHRSGPVGERITDNTLIRVAIDLLLSRVDDLAGSTETELRNSVSQ